MFRSFKCSDDYQSFFSLSCQMVQIIKKSLFVLSPDSKMVRIIEIG